MRWLIEGHIPWLVLSGILGFVSTVLLMVRRTPAESVASDDVEPVVKAAVRADAPLESAVSVAARLAAAAEMRRLNPETPTPRRTPAPAPAAELVPGQGRPRPKPVEPKRRLSRKDDTEHARADAGSSNGPIKEVDHAVVNRWVDLALRRGGLASEHGAHAEADDKPALPSVSDLVPFEEVPSGAPIEIVRPPVAEPVAGPVAESAPAVAEPAAEVVVEPIPEPAAEPVVEPVFGQGEPVAEHLVEPPVELIVEEPSVEPAALAPAEPEPEPPAVAEFAPLRREEPPLIPEHYWRSPTSPRAQAPEQLAELVPLPARQPDPVVARPGPAYDPESHTPFGAGSIASRMDGMAPRGYPIKGNLDSMLFHTEASRYFTRVRADVWFDCEATAREAGFTRWDERGTAAHQVSAAR